MTSQVTLMSVVDYCATSLNRTLLACNVITDSSTFLTKLGLVGLRAPQVKYDHLNTPIGFNFTNTLRDCKTKEELYILLLVIGSACQCDVSCFLKLAKMIRD